MCARRLGPEAARAHVAAAIDHAGTLTDEAGVMNGANWEQQMHSVRLQHFSLFQLANTLSLSN